MRAAARVVAASALWPCVVGTAYASTPREPAYVVNVEHYVDAVPVTRGPSDYVPVLSAPSGTVSGCMTPTATASACARSSARIGELMTQALLRESAPEAIGGSSESANGFAAFRDAVVVRGLPAGRYHLVPTVSVQGTATWNVIDTPFTANIALLVFGGDGDTVLQNQAIDATQASFATTVTLTGISFDAGVPFNVMIALGQATRIMRGTTGSVNTLVDATFTLRVTGLAVVDAQGRAVSGYEIGAMSGASYGPGGITPRTFAATDFDLVVSGPEETMIPNTNPWGLRWTPDEAVSFRTVAGEIRMWFVAGTYTILMRGPTFESLTPFPLSGGQAVPLIGPSGTGFDKNYAGAASVVAAVNGRDLLMFYHAESHPCGNYLPFIAGIGLARSSDGGLTWHKRGQVLAGADPTPTTCTFPNSGVGNPTVFRSRDGRWLYMVFMEWRSGTSAVPAQGLFLARAPIESDGEAGSWQKFAYGAFVEPGLGGDATPILLPPHPASVSRMAAAPSISWNAALGRYVMVFQTFDGFYAATSDDGLYWDRIQRIWEDIPIFVSTPTRPWVAYPSLVSPDQPSQEITGAHGYLYFARGFFDANPPHVMSRLRYDIRVPSSNPTDNDADGLPDAWERAFGLDPSNAADATGDDDADGASNLEEHRAGTHPRATFTRYLAEGATGALFDTSIALLNPSGAPAQTLLTFLRSDGTARTEALSVPAAARRTVNTSLVPGMQVAEFGTTIESDRPLVAERTMRWPAGADAYGSHADRALASPSTTWYLAEGATHSGFELFYLIQNPGPEAARVEVEFLLPAPARPRVQTLVVPPRSRFTVWVDTVDGLDRTDVSGVVRADVPIIVERAMYLTGGRRLFEAGHESAGITSPERRWFLAEGATGPYFDTFILLANPGDDVATVEVTYLLPNGTELSKPYVVEPRSRFTIWVDTEDATLADTAVSAVVRATNDVPIIAERAMWWPGPSFATWAEAHASPGATETAGSWCVADGESGPGIDTYLLVANTSTQPARIRATLFFEDGAAPVSAWFDVAPTSRFNVYPPVHFASSIEAMTRRRFGVRIDAEPGPGSQPAPALVVERATYSSDGNRAWAAGSNALATPCP